MKQSDLGKSLDPTVEAVLEAVLEDYSSYLWPFLSFMVPSTYTRGRKSIGCKGKRI
jgi:hypothetical protein